MNPIWRTAADIKIESLCRHISVQMIQVWRNLVLNQIVTDKMIWAKFEFTDSNHGQMPQNVKLWKFKMADDRHLENRHIAIFQWNQFDFDEILCFVADWDYNETHITNTLTFYNPTLRTAAMLENIFLSNSTMVCPILAKLCTNTQNPSTGRLALPRSIPMTEDRTSLTRSPRASVLCELNTLCDGYSCPLLDIVSPTSPWSSSASFFTGNDAM